MTWSLLKQHEDEIQNVCCHCKWLACPWVQLSAASCLQQSLRCCHFCLPRITACIFITLCNFWVAPPLHVSRNSKPKNTQKKTLVSQLNHFWIGSFPTDLRNYSSAMCLRVCVFPCLSQYSLLVGIQLHFFFFFDKFPLPTPQSPVKPQTLTTLTALSAAAE